MNIEEVPKLAVIKGGQIVKVFDEDFDPEEVKSTLVE